MKRLNGLQAHMTKAHEVPLAVVLDLSTSDLAKRHAALSALGPLRTLAIIRDPDRLRDHVFGLGIFRILRR